MGIVCCRLIAVSVVVVGQLVLSLLSSPVTCPRVKRLSAAGIVASIDVVGQLVTSPSVVVFPPKYTELEAKRGVLPFVQKHHRTQDRRRRLLG